MVQLIVRFRTINDQEVTVPSKQPEPQPPVSHAAGPAKPARKPRAKKAVAAPTAGGHKDMKAISHAGERWICPR